MELLALGFLAASAARSVALRLTLVAIISRRRMKKEVRLRVLEGISLEKGKRVIDGWENAASRRHAKISERSLYVSPSKSHG